jgi:hypothetical protein
MPDGRSFLIDARRDDTLAPITVMLNWAAGLTSAPGEPPVEDGVTDVARESGR